jgi:hypothetical protein
VVHSVLMHSSCMRHQVICCNIDNSGAGGESHRILVVGVRGGWLVVVACQSRQGPSGDGFRAATRLETRIQDDEKDRKISCCGILDDVTITVIISPDELLWGWSLGLPRAEDWPPRVSWEEPLLLRRRWCCETHTQRGVSGVT